MKLTPQTAMALGQPLPQLLALAQAQFDGLSLQADAADPFAIALPPMLGTAGAPVLASGTVRMLGALYLNAELEQAGLPLAAELLAQAKLELSLMSAEAARLLDNFDTMRRTAYTREQRELLFARLFGIGGGAVAARGAAVNNEFQRLLATFCTGILRTTESLLPGGSTAVRQTFVRDAALTLASNLAARQFGNTVAAGQALQRYTQRAIELLTHPGMLTHFGVRGLWELLAKLFGPAVPDMGRIVTRGQSGMRVLIYLAEGLPALQAQPLGTLPQASDIVATSAAQWLQASGLAATS